MFCHSTPVDRHPRNPWHWHPKRESSRFDVRIPPTPSVQLKVTQIPTTGFFSLLHPRRPESIESRAHIPLSWAVISRIHHVVGVDAHHLAPSNTLKGQFRFEPQWYFDYRHSFGIFSNLEVSEVCTSTVWTKAFKLSSVTDDSQLTAEMRAFRKLID